MFGFDCQKLPILHGNNGTYNFLPIRILYLETKVILQAITFQYQTSYRSLVPSNLVSFAACGGVQNWESAPRLNKNQFIVVVK